MALTQSPRQDNFVGLLLGIVWAPCIGPTLGAAIALASQGEALASVAIVMVIFSLGAVIPLIAIGLLSRQFFRENVKASLMRDKKDVL